MPSVAGCKMSKVGTYIHLLQVLKSEVVALLVLQSNSFIEGVSHKIRRQIDELEKVSGGEGGALTVDGVPVETYVTR